MPARGLWYLPVPPRPFPRAGPRGGTIMMGERERRRLRRRGERMLEHGLRLPVQRDDLVDALLLLDDRFTSSPSEGRAVQLAADALSLFDATLRRNPFVHELACK